VADIFFSYSRKDKKRVSLVRNALADMGFEVTDRALPTNMLANGFRL
jgi:hypothetical protein